MLMSSLASIQAAGVYTPSTVPIEKTYGSKNGTGAAAAGTTPTNNDDEASGAEQKPGDDAPPEQEGVPPPPANKPGSTDAADGAKTAPDDGETTGTPAAEVKLESTG